MARVLTNEEFWKKGIKKTCLKLNLAWLVSSATKPFSFCLLILSAVIFYVRWKGDSYLGVALSGVAFSALLALGVAFCLLKGKWECREETVNRLDDELDLNNGLTMAERGALAYPSQKKIPQLFYWRMQYFFPPLFSGLTGLALAFFIPISSSNNEASLIKEPLAWSQLEEDLAHLKEEELIQEEYVEEKERELEELRALEPEEWYDHSTLEATDHLMNQHQQEKEQLSSHLEASSESLREMANPQGSASALKDAHNDFQEALKSMETAQLKPNKELLKQMEKISPEGIKKLSAEDVQQLRERMEGAADQLSEESNHSASGLKDGKTEGEGGKGGGDKGESPNGKPGLGRGPGHEEILYSKPQERLAAEADGALQAQDLSSFTPGDLLELHDAAPEVSDRTKGVRVSGGAQHLGMGGNRVWKQALLPAEQEALKSYFSNDTINK